MALSKLNHKSFVDTVEGNPSLIINGDMSMAQRASSVTGVGSSSGYFVQDRWSFFNLGSAAARWTQSVSTDVPASSTFTSSLKLDCTTASGTVGADDRQQIMQIIEAQDLQHLKYGSADAKQLTVSFWVKSSVTGKNYCWLYHYDGTRFSYKSYTINSADTWEYKTLTFSGDTVSAITDDNGQGLGLIWMLYAGADYTGATDGVEDTWAAWSSANYDQFNGQVNNASSTSNNWYLTGVKLEVGSTASPFQHESFADNLLKCQRFYTKSYDEDDAPGTSTQSGAIYHRNVGSSHSNRAVSVQFPVEMRHNPTITLYSLNGTSGNVSDCNTGYSHSANDTASISGTVGKRGFSKVSGISNADMMGFHYTAEIEL